MQHNDTAEEPSEELQTILPVIRPREPLFAQNLIGGEWCDGNDTTSTLVSPYDGHLLGTLLAASAEQVDEAVLGAQRAAREWRGVPLKERGEILLNLRELMRRDSILLARSAAAESGKTVAEAHAEVLKGIEVLEFACAVQNFDTGGILEVSRGVSCEVRREPLGVTVGITPFNFPVMVPMWMIPISIAVGNSFIWKPSDKVPFTPSLLGKLLLEAGVPKGIFSIVHGGAGVVEQLVRHPDVAAVGFVGSTPVARKVYVDATSSGKRALCLGGAKNHLIVMPDAPLDLTVEGVLSSFTGCAGQRCMAGSVLIAVGDTEEILKRVVQRTREVRLGFDMGAIISRESRDRLAHAIERAGVQGGKILVDGREASAPSGLEGGFWLGASVIDRVVPGMECAHTELFGPVLSIMRVNTLDDALTLHASSPYGNATSIFTSNGGTARHVTEHAQTGMVGVNIGVPVPREPFSFGGTKDSKFGAGDITGRSAVDFWTNLKKISTKWAKHTDMNWMS